MMTLAVMLAAAPVPPKPVEDPGMWITPDDYPAGALKIAQTGTTIVELLIDSTGRVRDCHTESSSGSIELDATACALFKVRGKFTPARDATGKRVDGVHRQRVTWEVPDKSSPLPPKAQIVAIAVDVDQEGLVEGCKVTEGAEWVIPGQPTPCIRFPVGSKTRQATGRDGEPVSYRMVMRQITEITAR